MSNDEYGPNWVIELACSFVIFVSVLVVVLYTVDRLSVWLLGERFTFSSHSLQEPTQ